eukprot:TRINITY_DN39233_c0_g1_i1.p2 TRINITY_DN39233_c0_g1~~TRINITY_DN39233_c0_g1_i1.p2  ORF type:complete len:120 (-),score=22.25 TRINITY_DN39233_c0_g1_i1:300-659(-)
MSQKYEAQLNAHDQALARKQAEAEAREQAEREWRAGSVVPSYERYNRRLDIEEVSRDLLGTTVARSFGGSWTRGATAPRSYMAPSAHIIQSRSTTGMADAGNNKTYPIEYRSHFGQFRH